jgi:glyoxylase-like metal-dependent hydrolase (beta-lactamase superfamily II)
MNDKLKTGFSDRLKTAAAAKQALLEKLRPRPTQINPQHDTRADDKAAELLEVRQERTAAKVAKQQAAADAVLAAAAAKAEAEDAALTAKRGERKERKALSAADAKAKRDAKYAARQARR